MRRKIFILAVIFGLAMLYLTASAAMSTTAGDLTFTATNYKCEYCGYGGDIGDVPGKKSLEIYNFQRNNHEVTLKLLARFTCPNCEHYFARSSRIMTIVSDNGCTEPFYKAVVEPNICYLQWEITGPAIGHCPIEEVTCQEKGVCTRCGVTFGEFAEHNYQNYVVVKDFTCKENAIETGKCKWCDETDTRTAENSAKHVFEAYISNNDATCQTNCTETSKCKWAEELGCTETHTREIANSKAPCQMGEYVSDNNATCQTNCTETRECIWWRLGCNNTETRDIPNTKVDHEDGKTKLYSEATCTNNEVYIVYCKWENLGCDYFKLVDEPYTYLGHSYRRAWQEVSCTEAEGYKYTCRRCGYSEMRFVEQEALGHYYGEWEYRKDGVHRASCVREGCDKVSDKPCELFEVTDGENVKTLCPVCGRFGEEEFEIMYGVKFMPLEKGALPEHGERLIRVMEAPVEGSLFGFTIGYEYFGEMVPFNGKVAVEMKLNGRIDEKFCLVRVDTVPETETAPRSENWVNVDFTFEDGILKFEADRTALYLLLPAAR